MSNEGYVDDPSVKDEAKLLRRIPPDWIVPDPKNRAGKRASSQAFDDDRDGKPMSVQLADVLIAHGIPVTQVLAGHGGYSLTAITAGLARANGQGIIRKPRENDPAHAEVFGKKSKSVRKKLADGAEWVILPAN